MIKRRGFTLAEVMVTIGLLGVLAAILTPAILNTTPNANRVMFKKAYSIAETAVSNMINDDTYYPAGGSPGFSNTSATGLPAGVEKFCYLFSQQVNILGAAPSCSSSSYTFLTTDGVKWKLYPGSFTVGDIYNYKLLIDVNGDKAPNYTNDTQGATYGFAVRSASTDPNPDQFVIGVRYDGRLQVGANDTTAVKILSDPTNNKKF